MHSLLLRSVKLYLVLLIVSTLAILYGTLVPSDYVVPSSWSGYDKLAHFLMFAAWTFFYGLVRMLKGNPALFSVLITGAFFGLSIELLQYFLPFERSPETLDFAADLGGVLIAILALYILSKKVPALMTSSAG